MDGSSGRPSASGSTVAVPLRIVATSELVVPRSMPTASRCSCGTGDMPGSEICSRAMPLAGLQPLHLFDLLVGRVDFRFEPIEEHQLAYQPGRAGVVFPRIDGA